VRTQEQHSKFFLTSAFQAILLTLLTTESPGKGILLKNNREIVPSYMTKADTLPAPSHYSVLGLPSPLSGQYVSTQQIRAAFRHSLLLHHPDKAASIGVTKESCPVEPAPSPSKHSIDEIRCARDVLVDPSQRREYDRSFIEKAVITSGRNGGVSNGSLATSEQIETVDLDDMEYGEDTQTWTRACRCGNAKAYEVSEGDLTGAMAHGYREISVGCDGCSLHIRVIFDVGEDFDDSKDMP